MGRLVFADSSGLIAKFFERDPNHVAADEEMRRLAREGRRFLTTNYIFDEVVTRTRRLAGFPWSRAVGESILSSKLIRRVFIDEEEEDHSWDLYLKHQQVDLSFTDATSLAITETYGLTEVFSFDEDFLKLGLTLLPRPAGD